MRARSKENEEKAMLLLMKMCKRSIGKFPDSLKQDLELLKKDNLTRNERNCITLRADEKRIYHFFIQLAKDAIEVLKGRAGLLEANPKAKAYYDSIKHLLD